MKKLKKSFTLAEVLIVISLLGIIATLVISSTVKGTQKTILKTRFIKAYSVLENFANILYIENPDYYADIMKLSAASYQRPVVTIDMIRPYFNINDVKNTGRGSTKEPLSKHKNINGGDTKIADWFEHGFIELKDGMTIFPDFAWSGGIYFGVDTNGYRNGPNKFGYDFFLFELGKNGNIITNISSLPGHLGDDPSKNAGLLNTDRALKEKDYFKNLP